MNPLAVLRDFYTRTLIICGLLASCATAYPVSTSPVNLPAPVTGKQQYLAGTPWEVRLLGEARLPYRLNFEETIVGGLSGLDYDPATNRFFLISDDRSEQAPARFYTATLNISESGFSEVALKSVVTLRSADGHPLPRGPSLQAVDPESIRFDPRRRSVFWTSEGDRSISPLGTPFAASRLIDPAVREAGLDGRFIAELPLAPMFRMNEIEQGPRANLAFEGLALAPDGRSLWVAMEGPRFEDGPVANRNSGAQVRLSRLARDRGRPDQPALLAQYFYLTEPVQHRPILPGGIAENGVSEILALSEDLLLVLERSYSLGRGMTVRLFEADLSNASDVRMVPSLSDENPMQSIKPAKKRLVLDFVTLGLEHLDNIEGMSWGPTLANGNRTLVFVSDDNFNPLQTTQFFAFELIRP